MISGSNVNCTTRKSRCEWAKTKKHTSRASMSSLSWWPLSSTVCSCCFSVLFSVVRIAILHSKCPTEPSVCILHQHSMFSCLTVISLYSPVTCMTFKIESCSMFMRNDLLVFVMLCMRLQSCNISHKTSLCWVSYLGSLYDTARCSDTGGRYWLIAGMQCSQLSIDICCMWLICSKQLHAAAATNQRDRQMDGHRAISKTLTVRSG